MTNKEFEKIFGNVPFENIEKIKKYIQEQLEKKDKQIDLMARAIDNYDSQLEINTFKDKEHIKQYFADLVEKE